MINAIEHYLTVRGATGFTLSNTTYLLRSFGRFAVARGDTHIRTATAIAWAAQSVSATQRSERLKTVCRLARYLHVDDARHEIPPANHFGSPKQRPVPYIYSPGEIRQLLAAARQLPPLDSVRPHTYATVLGLLAATGLRVSEALTLHLADLTPSGLVIRKTKFGKTRLVPLHATTVQVLEQYRSRWCLRQSAEAKLFVDEDGHPLQLLHLRVDHQVDRFVGCDCHIEQGFKITKRGGWQWQRTRMSDPQRAARLWLAVAVATLWLLSVRGMAEDTLPVSTLLPLADADGPTSRPRPATQLRLVSAFRQGWITILVALLNHQRLPQGRFVPEPWPQPYQPNALSETPELRLAA